MNLSEAISAAALLAVAGAGHCLGMCGGISLGLSMAVQEDRRRGKRLWLWQALFAIGRVSTYTILGALAGAFGQLIIDTLPGAGPVAWMLSAILMLLLALMLLGHDVGLGKLERVGLAVWRRIQPLTTSLVPIRHSGQALLLGALWGFLPCGLLYTALALSVATGSALNGATVMLVFGLVTVPPVAAGGVATGLLTVLRRQGWRRLTAVLTLIMAGWLFWQGLAGAHGHHHQSDSSQQNPVMEPSHPHHH
ncbi:sulfite exporter TauE/SafE family protein [Alcanivorax sp. 1008]|uniref:sulfite exporter TauE/SafE family protein n=1 Tax=Alcanivorax sp. 1008 TaxID=2816853 RepID=UPI001DD9597B|nr:sulfite exporter TauE/SafE family protein [Alcanivorax sp. 1008]MCC1497754.1 sulfite exporter TauE/SafE family protein [Alcanivorax sp. 1008]